MTKRCEFIFSRKKFFKISNKQGNLVLFFASGKIAPAYLNVQEVTVPLKVIKADLVSTNYIKK